jgi:hypothetical protein
MVKRKISLPVDANLPEIPEKLNEAASVLLEAAPGAGETARVPSGSCGVTPNAAGNLQVVVGTPGSPGDRKNAIRYIGLALKNGLPASQLESGPELKVLIKTRAVKNMLQKK